MVLAMVLAMFCKRGAMVLAMVLAMVCKRGAMEVAMVLAMFCKRGAMVLAMVFAMFLKVVWKVPEKAGLLETPLPHRVTVFMFGSRAGIQISGEWRTHMVRAFCDAKRRETL